MKNHFNPLVKLSLIILVLTHYSCQKDKLDGDIITDPAIIENLYANASDTLLIDHQKLILQTEISRDFFPGGPIDNKNHRLAASLFIVNCDSTLITPNFKVSKLYVINNNQAWVSEPESRTDIYLPEYEVYLVSINGPEWDTGINVDVVISLTDLTNNQEHYLIARDQIIQRVE